MSQLTLLPSADLLPGAPGYPAYAAAVYSKLNELAVAMSIAQFTTSTIANGQGNPAADMTAAKNKINELVAVLNSIPSLPATYFDFRSSSVGFGLNVYDLNYTNYRFRSSAAKVLVLSNARKVTPGIFNNMPSPPQSGGLLVYDGATFVGSYTIGQDINLPGVGMRLLAFIEGGHERPNDEGEAQGTSLLSLTFPAGTTNTIITPVASDTGMLVVGDSIAANGLGATMPSRFGLVPRLRDILGYDIISDGWGYRSFGKSLGTDDLLEEQADRIVNGLSAYKKRIAWLALSTNDDVKGFSTPTQSGDICRRLLGRILAKDASIKIYVQSMLYTTSYTQPILDAANAYKSQGVEAVNGTGLAPNSSASHIHPNDSEYATYAASVASIVSGGTAVNPNEPAKGELVQAANSVDSRFTEVGPFGYFAPTAADNDASPPGGSLRYASAANASVSGKFTGTRMRVDFNLQPTGGIAELFIDGVSVGTFNQKSSGSTNEGGGYFISPLLSAGSHTFTFKKATSGGGGNLFYSQLAVMDAGGTFTN